MTITFTYAARHSDCDANDDLESGSGLWRLEIDGTVNNLFKAASIVRTGANENDPASVRLVRILMDAKTPEQISSAISAFRKWTVEIINDR